MGQDSSASTATLASTSTSQACPVPTSTSNPKLPQSNSNPGLNPNPNSDPEEPLFAVLGPGDLFVLPERYRPSTLSVPPSTPEPYHSHRTNSNSSSSSHPSSSELNFQSVTGPILAPETLTATRIAEQVHKSAAELQSAKLTHTLPRTTPLTDLQPQHLTLVVIPPHAFSIWIIH